MAERRIFFILAGFLLILGSQLRAGDSYQLRLYVYHGSMMQETAVTEEVLWRASHEPLLASLRKAVGAQDMEWSAAVVQTLFDLTDLEAADELFSISRNWDGRTRDWLDRFLGNDAAFRLETSAKRSPDMRITFQVTAFRSKEGIIPQNERPETKARRAIEAGANPKKMDKILEENLTLDPGDPVVICTPWKEGAFFVVICLVPSVPQPKASMAAASEIEIVAAPRPLRQVQPYYPDSLRERRIEGKVGLLIAVDKSGAVIGTRVTEPLHPYLDYSVVQALLGWRFEPIFKNGKPVDAVFPYTFQFERMAPPQTYGGSQVEAGYVPTSVKLDEALAGSAAYCQSLAGSMLDYVCEETINEIGYKLRARPQQEIVYTRQIESIRTNLGIERGMVGVRLTLMDPQLTKRTRYLCDYQIIKDRDVVKERRMILKIGGRKATEGLILEEKRYSFLMPVLTGLKVLSAGRQGLFMFRLTGEGKVQGRECDIVEAIPKRGNEEGIELARVWIDKKDYRIRKIEIEGVPVEGFEEVLADCVQLSIHPRFVATNEYGTDYKGVLLPSRTAVRIEYLVPRSLGGTVLKTTIDMKYSKYRYFGVKTESQIIK